MPKRIANLSAEQKARFPEFVDKWAKIGLCIDPANRPAAEEGVRLSYRTAGLEPPEKIVWCDSPLAMGLTQNMAKRSSEAVGDAARDLVVAKCNCNWPFVWDSVKKMVRDSVQNQVQVSVVGSVWLAIRSAMLKPDVVLDSVYGEHSAGWDFLRDSFYGERSADWRLCLEQFLNFNVDDSAQAVLLDSVLGQHGAAWCAYFDYFRMVCGLTEETARFLGEEQVAANAGMWLPHQNICWICERPSRLRFDDRGRLHCEDGPALSYPGGWSIYSIHGVLVEAQVIMSPRTQSVKKIRNEPNAEVRRIRIERFGWREYLRAVRARVLDTRDNDVEVTKEALMRTPDGEVVLVCACPSTSRVYSLQVPPTITTCEGAQDWLSGGLSRRVINGA